jgi:hypothetical protein
MLSADDPFARGYAEGAERTTVMLPGELDARLRFEARRRGVSIAELIREAVEARYGRPPGPRRLSFEALPIEPGYPGFPPDAATRYEEHLAEMIERDYFAMTGRVGDADR